MNLITKTTITLSIILFMSTLCVNAQMPVVKVDLNVLNRKESEVNEPGYIPWPLGGTESKTIEGVTFEFKNGEIDNSWYKAGIQVPYYARLVSDGIKSEKVELHISGLMEGKHNLVTFHNAFSNPANNVFSNVDIYINDVLVVNDLKHSERVLSNDESVTAFLEFEVSENETVVIRFQSNPLPSSTNYNVYLCGFHLNAANPKTIARFEYPSNNDEHVDIDNDTLIFSWQPPEETVSQNFYFGMNEANVAAAQINSPEFIGNVSDTFYVKTGFYNMDKYFWRVDPISAAGDTVKGDVWYFKKRIKAFPEAEGYGGYAIGGRGGDVVYVTNLNDDGPGSFRYAAENATGPRTVLFAVSGLITLEDRIMMNKDYLTIAGQSAPGKGICFRWAPIGVTGDNLIVQNIRVRLGYGITYDGMGLTGANYSIVDHCSVSWTIDEAFSSRGSENITLQRSLISEALNDADHEKQHSEHGYAGSIGGNTGSFHHNLLAHCNGRNWSMAGGLDGNNYYAGKLDIFNMVVYNWGSRATDGGAKEVNFVNNYYKKGAATTQSTILKADLEGTGLGSQSYYSAGNIVENTSGSFQCDGTDNTCSRTYTLSNGQILDWDVFVDEPFFPSWANIHSARDAYKLVLSDVGCRQPVFDDHDKRIINETLTGTYTYKGSKTGKAGLPDREWDVGSWEAYPGFHRAENWDSDLDGLPDWWENAHGLNPGSASVDFSDSNADVDKNGYTNLEEFLHWMDKPHYFMTASEEKEIDLNVFTRGFTNNPSFELSNVVNGNARITDNNALVLFSPSAEGMAGFTFTVTDAEGTSMSQNIGFYVGALPADSGFTYTYQDRRSGGSTITVESTDWHVPINNMTHSDFSISNIKLFPNPVDNLMRISFNTDKSEISSFDIAIVDMVGKVFLRESHLLKNKHNVLNVNVQSLTPGIYSLLIDNNGHLRRIKFTKE